MNYSYIKSLGLLSRTIAKDLGKNLEEKLTLENIRINARQWSVISLLKHEKSSSQKNIGAVFGYDKVMVMRMVKSLEESGIVQKRICNKDKRTRIVCLTPEGEELYNRILPIAEKTLTEAYKGLSEREIDLYTQISELIIKNLKSR